MYILPLKLGLLLICIFPSGVDMISQKSLVQFIMESNLASESPGKSLRGLGSG